MVATGSCEEALAPVEPRAAVTFVDLYRRYFHECCRWVRAMGVPDSDLEDIAQEVFTVANRKLLGTEVRDPGAWLYRIAWLTVSDHRRRAWFRNLFSRRGRAVVEELPAPEGPVEIYERAERARLLQLALDRMTPIRRTTFVLYEIEGYSGEEIAALQGIPLKTVWTRLHHARKSFVELLDEVRRRNTPRRAGEAKS
jgi:RNA polymerase sigma-70 factor (ECF subfamily)